LALRRGMSASSAEVQVACERRGAVQGAAATTPVCAAAASKLGMSR
jgi:hypothetical protein